MFRMNTCGAWFIGIATAFWCNCALAQVIPDSTLSNNSIININGKTFNITGGTQAGGNLFHSFQQFSVPTGSEAFFNNPVDIQNIISRVTGGSISNIDGLIRTLGTANLFLINPNGIVFGPNARLNIGGSFIASTASSINFADGTKFSATPSPDKPLLTITAPLGLNMGSNPGTIQVQGSGHDIEFQDIKQQPRFPVNSSVSGLELKPGNTLALVGGKVSVEGGILKSPAGRVEIGSVGSNGTVSLVPIQEGWKLGYEGTPSFGDIQFSGRAFVDTTGVSGGSIAVTGRNISLAGESILLAETRGERNGQQISIVGDEISVIQSEINTGTFSSGNAGEVKLVANKSILLENNGGAGTNTQGLGKAGEITLKADSIEVRNGSGLGSSTFGKGYAGGIEIKANSLLIEKKSGFSTSSKAQGNAGEMNIVVGDFVVRNFAGLTVSTEGVGNGGKINITANSLRIEDNSTFTSATTQAGQAGEINLNVAGSLVFRNFAGIDSNTSGTGNAGKISITANSLRIEDNSTFTSSTTQAGQAGEINLNVAGSLVFRNFSAVDNNTSGTGNAGKLNITANSLLIEDNSGFTSGTEQGSTGQAGEINLNVAGPLVVRKQAGMNSNTSGTGNAGTLKIAANSLLIEDYSGFDSTTKEGSTGQGGEINVNIAGSLVLRNYAGIDSNTLGTGDAGQITVSAETLEISNVSGMSLRTIGNGNAGNLNVRAKTVNLDSEGRLRVSSAGTGNAGTLKIVADTIKLDNGSRMDATTTSGNGGDLTLNVANLLLLRNGSQISATAGTAQQGGNGGNITINAPNGFIVSAPNKNNDITANAFNGSGGKININSLGIFNFTQRSREDLVRELGTDNPNELNPQKLKTNDITAFSQTNSTLSGQVTIKTPDVDTSKGLVELPTVLVQTSKLIADTSCGAIASTDSDTDKSRFTITGRGGLPPSPNEPLTTDVLWLDTRLAALTTQPQRSERHTPQPPSKADAVKIVPATGWVFDGKGHVTLISHASNANNLGSTPACQKK